MSLTYSTTKTPTASQYISLLHRANFAARRPVDDLPVIESMLKNANLFITAWDQNQTLIGAARSVTDFAFCCYLSDLAVDQAHQKQGVGKHLIRLTQSKLGPKAKIILLAAPDARAYYPKLGFDPHPSAWTLPATKPIP